jgi:hypothetical protein
MWRIAVITNFVEACQTARDNKIIYYPAIGVVGIVFAGTSDTDSLRKFLVDCFVFEAHNGWVIGAQPKDCPHEFTFEVMLGMIKERPAPDIKTANIHNASYYCDVVRDREERELENSDDMESEDRTAKRQKTP